MYLSDRKRRDYLSLPLPQNLYPKKLSLKDMRFLQKGPYKKANRNNEMLSMCVNKGVKVLYEKHIQKACTQETPIYLQLWEKNIKVYKQCSNFKFIPHPKGDLSGARPLIHVCSNTGNISSKSCLTNENFFTENERKRSAASVLKAQNTLQTIKQQNLQERGLPFSTSLSIFVQTIKTQDNSLPRMLALHSKASRACSTEPSLRNKASACSATPAPYQSYMGDSKINIIKNFFLTPSGTKRDFSLEKSLYYSCRTFATPPLFVNGKNKYLYCRYLYNVEHLKNGLNSQMVHSQNFNKGGKRAIHEKKKIALFYGQIAKRDMQRLCKSAHALPGVFFDNMYTLLESRVDVCVYRAGFSNTIAMARQQIRNGYFERNGKKIRSCKIYNKPGDIISYKCPSGALKDTILKSYKHTTKTLYQLWYSVATKSGNYAEQDHHDILFLMQNTQTGAVVLYKDVFRDIFKKRQKNVQDFYDKTSDKKSYERCTYSAPSSVGKPKWKYSCQHLLDDSNPTFAHILTPGFFVYRDLCKNLFVPKVQISSSSHFPHTSREGKTGNSSMLYIGDIKKYPMVFFSNVYCAALLRHNVRKRQLFTVTLNGERYLKTFKKNIHNMSTASTWGQKPLHLEISYKTYTFIYLYRPQKIISSFCLDFDALKA